MKYILVSLPALVSVASAAEIVGTYYMPAIPAPASVVEVSSQATEAAVAATGEYTVSAATSTAPMEPSQTPVPASSWAATEEVPYWHMTQYGYQQMACGYGYRKDDQSYCKPESWYDHGDECYETVIFNKKKYCAPEVVTMTEDVTVYVTEQQPKTIYSTTTMVEKKIDTATKDVTQLVTATELLTTVRIWVSTEVKDQTKTALHTLTATDTLTSIALQTELATATETATKIEKEVLTKTENEVTTILQPTTYTSVWLTTEVNNETETLVKTKSKTVVDTMTQVKTVDATNTVTETAVDKKTTLIPTTVVSKYTTTEVINETQTTERVVETTIAQTQTAEVTESEITTATHVVQATALNGCPYGDCKSSYKSYEPSKSSYGSYEPSKPYGHQEGYQKQYDGYQAPPY